MAAMERMQLGLICSANDDDDEPIQVAGREMMISIIKAYGAREKRTLCLAGNGSVYITDATPGSENKKGVLDWIEDSVSSKITNNFAMAPLGFEGHILICGNSHLATDTLDGRFVMIYYPRQGKVQMGDMTRRIETGSIAVTLLDGSVFVWGMNIVRIHGLAGWIGPDVIMPIYLMGHAGALMPDGRVLICGGNKPDTPWSKECLTFDPSSGTLGEAAPMRLGRLLHAAVALPDGRILVCGTGKREDSICEIYDPQTNNWEPAAAMIHRRVGHMATIVYDVPPGSPSPDEERPVVLVYGGIYTDTDSLFEAYDIENDKWYITERFAFDRQRRVYGMCVTSHYQ